MYTHVLFFIIARFDIAVYYNNIYYALWFSSRRVRADNPT
jgi:hypothetical protein